MRKAKTITSRWGLDGRVKIKKKNHGKHFSTNFKHVATLWKIIHSPQTSWDHLHAVFPCCISRWNKRNYYAAITNSLFSSKSSNVRIFWWWTNRRRNQVSQHSETLFNQPTQQFLYYINYSNIPALMQVSNTTGISQTLLTMLLCCGSVWLKTELSLLWSGKLLHYSRPPTHWYLFLLLSFWLLFRFPLPVKLHFFFASRIKFLHLFLPSCLCSSCSSYRAMRIRTNAR